MTRGSAPRGAVAPAEAARLLPSAVVLATWIALMPGAGGFQQRDWLPAGLVLLGALVAAVAGERRLLPASRPARLALVALAAFTAWNFVSLAWSDAPGLGWDAANLLLTVLLAAWVLALAPWRVLTADLLLVGFSLGAAVVCAVTLLQALGAADLSTRFLDFRFNQPLDYPNASAAFAFMAAIPALVLAARPDVPVVVKAPAQGLATFLAGYALLPQSRGSVLGAAAALVVLLLVVPFRWRLALHAAALGGLLVLVSGPVFDVYRVAAGSPTGLVSPALAHAARALGVATILGVAAGAALGLAADRVRPRAAGRRAARSGGVAAVAVAALAVAGAAGANAERLGDALRDQWRSLTHPGVAFAGRTEAQLRPGAAGRLANPDPLERYDYWRVAVAGFLDAPVGGMGAGGFEHRYTLQRRYAKVSKYPHNLAMKVLGDGGAVGVMLIAAALGALAAGLLRRLRDLGPGERGIVAAAAAMLAYFTAHGMFDWLEAYPVLTGPAFAPAFVALAVRDGAARGPAVVPRLRPVATGIGAVAAVAGAGSLLAPWLAVRYVDRAQAGWRVAPEAAYRDLERAARLNPLSTAPPLVEGTIGVVRGDLDRAQIAFRRALGREETWLPEFGLAAVAAARGDRAEADRRLARAVAENRRDPRLPDAARAIRSGRRVDPAALMRQVLVSPLFHEERLR